MAARVAKEVGVLADHVAKEVRVISCPCSQRGRGHLMTVRVATERTEVGHTNTTTKHMQTNGHRTATDNIQGRKESFAASPVIPNYLSAKIQQRSN